MTKEITTIIRKRIIIIITPFRTHGDRSTLFSFSETQVTSVKQKYPAHICRSTGNKNTLPNTTGLATQSPPVMSRAPQEHLPTGSRRGKIVHNLRNFGNFIDCWQLDCSLTLAVGNSFALQLPCVRRVGGGDALQWRRRRCLSCRRSFATFCRRCQESAPAV